MTLRDQVTEDDRWALWRTAFTKTVHIFHTARYDGEWALCGLPFYVLGEPKWKVRKESVQDGGSHQLCGRCRDEWVALFEWVGPFGKSEEPERVRPMGVPVRTFYVYDPEPGWERLGEGPYTVTFDPGRISDCTCTAYFFRKVNQRTQVRADKGKKGLGWRYHPAPEPCRHIEMVWEYLYPPVSSFPRGGRPIATS